MQRFHRFAWALIVGTSLVACGGGGSAKKESKKPVAKKTTKGKSGKPATKKPMTEEDRAKKREDQANKLVAADSTCLPSVLKDPASKLSLELGAVGSEAILCAMDHDEDRLLGAAGCWTVDLAAGALKFRDRSAIPGRGYHAAIERGCVRGFCLPKDQEVPAGQPALISWSLDGSQVAVAAGDQVHLFDAASKDLAKSIALRDPAQGDKVMPGTAKSMWFLGENLFFHGGEAGSTSIWAYKTDGSASGQLMGLGKGNEPVAMGHGSFSLLDKDRVAVSERGLSTLTIFEVGPGKRSKLVRKISNGPCRSAQVEAFFSTEAPADIPPKCASHLKNTFGEFMGTTIVAGSKNFLAALTGARIGELAVIDSKNLSEKRSIKLPWCESAMAPDDAKDEAEEASPKAGAALVEDPDAGGQVKAAGDDEEAAEEPAKPAKKPRKKKK